MDNEYLRALCTAHGVSGFEKEVMGLLESHCRPYADDLFYDAAGNLIVFRRGRKGSCGKTILWSAHADEVGFVITGADEDGTLTFDAIGMDPAIYTGRRVLIGENRVVGVMMTKPVHLLPRNERDKTPSHDDMRIDIGARSREEALAMGVYAAYAVFDTPYELFGEQKLLSKAIDDRIGCALVSALPEDAPVYDSYYAFCTCEEAGLRGSSQVAGRLKPDLTINVEGTTANDRYGVHGADRTCSLGGGPVMPFMDGASLYTRSVYNAAVKLAENEHFTFQTKHKVAGGTDAASYQRKGTGGAVLGVALPVRYLHSACSVASFADIEETEKLLHLFYREVDTLLSALPENKNGGDAE